MNENKKDMIRALIRPLLGVEAINWRPEVGPKGSIIALIRLQMYVCMYVRDICMGNVNESANKNDVKTKIDAPLDSLWSCERKDALRFFIDHRWMLLSYLRLIVCCDENDPFCMLRECFCFFFSRHCYNDSISAVGFSIFRSEVFHDAADINLVVAPFQLVWSRHLWCGDRHSFIYNAFIAFGSWSGIGELGSQKTSYI